MAEIRIVSHPEVLGFPGKNPYAITTLYYQNIFDVQPVAQTVIRKRRIHDDGNTFNWLLVKSFRYLKNQLMLFCASTTSVTILELYLTLDEEYVFLNICLRPVFRELESASLSKS